MIVGIDEVGRGAWAGPVVAGAVILDRPIIGLKDSKLLSAKQRRQLAIAIEEQASAVGLGWVWPAQVDELGLTAAVEQAMRGALSKIIINYSQIIIDGSYNFLADIPGVTAQIKADNHVPAVSAASIVAKVARDDYMAQMAKCYPNYSFEHNVGYGTAQHIGAIKSHGICALHRLSYRPIKMLLGVK